MEQRKRQFSQKLFTKIWMGLCVCLTVCMLDTVPVQAYESKDSFLYIGGTYMVRYGKTYTTQVKGERGTAVYNESANTLTLTNFKITHDEPIVAQYMSGLKIILKGVNELNSEGSGISAHRGSLIISGNGTLNIRSGTRKSSGTGILAKKDLTIRDCTVNVTSSLNPMVCNENLIIENSTVILKRTGVDIFFNDPDMNNNVYNRKIRFPALGAGSLKVSSSTLDMTGINYAFGVENRPVLGSNATVTDGNGTKLNLIKLRWPEIYEAYPDTTIFEYIYSKSNKDMIYSFDEAEKHVIIKSYPDKPDKPDTPDKPDKPDTPTNPETPDTGNVRGTFQVGNLYYTGTPSSRKVSCTGMANKKSTSVTIPSTVKIKGYTCKVSSIGKGAFKNCTRLRTVKIENNVSSIGAQAFYNCRRLKSLTFGKNITTISDRAFYKCSALTKVSIPAKTKTIKNAAFAHCTSLKSVKTGNGVSSIGTSAFYNCKKLSSLSLGKNITTISDRAFYKCSALTKVTFGAKTKYIKKEAFANCTRLKTITFEGKSLKTVGSRSFKNTKGRAKVILPKSRYNDYKKLLKGKGLKSPIYQKR